MCCCCCCLSLPGPPGPPLAAGCRLGWRAGRALGRASVACAGAPGGGPGTGGACEAWLPWRAGHLVLGVAPRADYHCHIYGGRVRTSCSLGCGAAAGSGSGLRRAAFCVCKGCERAREGAPGGSAGWLRLVSFSFLFLLLQSFVDGSSGPVCLLSVSLGSALLFRGAFRRGGRGWGRGRASESRTWRERGRGGRAASRLSGFKTEVGGKKKKSLQRSSSLLSPSLSRSLSRSQSWCVAEELEEEEEEERRLSGGQVQGSPQSAIQESHRNREDFESRGAGPGAPREPGRPGAEAGGPRRPERCPGPGESA